MNLNEATILIIDGKLASQKFYARLLESFFHESYQILTIGSGHQGTILCDRNQISCVLLANRLPDIGGLEFLRLLNGRLGEERKVPVVVLAEEDNEEEAKQAIKLGAFDFLVKGRFSQVSLVQAVRNAIDSARLHMEVVQSRRRLLEGAHQAGMAEIANGVLHQIGNNMNSVATSVDTISHALEHSRMRGLRQANELLDTFTEVLSGHPKGADLIRYFHSLEQKWDEERGLLMRETQLLLERVAHIRSDIYEQAHYANAELFLEELDVTKLVRDALRLHQNLLDAQGVAVEERCRRVPLARAVRVKLLLILNNLIRNAVECLGSLPAGERRITVGTRQDDEHSYVIFVSDNGPGIDQEFRDRIFNYGFTTKHGAHGVGLHVAANAATEMGGRLGLAPSQVGATFELTMPLIERPLAQAFSS